MKNKKTGIALGALGSVAVAVSLAVAFYVPRPMTGHASAELLQYIPEQADVLFSADLEQIRQTALYLAVERERKEQLSQALPELVQKTGIDPRTDLAQVAVATGFTPGPQGEPASVREGFLAVVKGRFDPARIGDLLTSHGAVSTTYRSHQVYLSLKGRQPIALCILSRSLLIFGSETNVQRALDVASGAGKSIQEDNQITDLRRNVDPEAQIWGVTSLEKLPSELPLRQGRPGPAPELQRQLIRSLQSLVGSLTVGDDLDLHLQGTAATAEDARLMVDTLKGALALARLNVKDPGLLELLRDVRIESSEQAMDLRIRVPGELVIRRSSQVFDRLR
ncbi:MAG: hypothetical protein HY652_10700 [Acidobacteria bacterium]|nr:hypothetical protein [Acidobacteriota bacterium]